MVIPKVKVLIAFKIVCQFKMTQVIDFFFFINLFIYLFIFGCIGSSLLRTGFLQLWRAGATLHRSARASHCGGFSCCGAQALGARASVVVARRLSSCGSWALERKLSSCGALAQLLHGMWDLPGPEIEPMFPALEGRFSTTEPPGKPTSDRLLIDDYYDYKCVLYYTVFTLKQNIRHNP